MDGSSAKSARALPLTFMVAERGSAEPRSAALRDPSNGSIVNNAEPYSRRAARPQPRGLWLLW
eukprot:12422901-Alexandrium_andersonii.AAC.1